MHPFQASLPSKMSSLHATELLAHQVKIANEVGATLHIEPNDTPRAGDPALVWFALTRRGGQPIPLGACDCQLAVYAQSSQPEKTPLLQPPLKPISAEGYQNIPGTELTFPEVGRYELVLEGTAQDGNAFESFELRYEVTVAAGAAPPSAAVASPAVSPAEPASPAPPWIGIGLGVIVIGAIAAYLVRTVAK